MIRIMCERICRNRYLKKGIIQGKQQEKISFLWVSGLLVLSFLGTKMPFSSGQEISRNIRNGFAKLIQVVLPDTWKAVGFSEGDTVRNICLGLLVLNVVIWVIVLLIHMLKWQELSSLEWCFLVTAASPVVTALIVAFTTVESSERYYFMWIFSMAFAAILSFECLRKGMTAGISAWKVLTVITLTTAGIVIGINIHTVYQPILNAEEPTASDALEVVNYLEENGYEMAYSTFENANKMTALSNGKVNVYAINSFETMDICKWLTNVDGYPEDGIADQDGVVYIVPEVCEEEITKRGSNEGEYQLLSEMGVYKISIYKKYTD